MSVQALVPLKALALAKSRLADTLRADERRALTQAMARDVLRTVVSHPRIARVTLLSDDPEADSLARDCGAWHCHEDATAGGLNAALTTAVKRLPPQRGARVVVLHADLPCLAATDLDAALALPAARDGVVVGPDRHRRGTNLLVFAAARPPVFAFGPGSCARHCQWARQRDVPVAMLERAGIAEDVDLPEDLRSLLAAARLGAIGAETRVVLNSLDLAGLPASAGAGGAMLADAGDSGASGRVAQ